MNSFGQFVQPQPKDPEEKLRESICMAFGQGMAAAKRNRSRRSNPHMPSSEEMLYQAWNCGFDEVLR